MRPARLALFDLDHTLLPLDSDYQWADYLARTGRAGDPTEARRRNEQLMEQYDAGQLSIEESVGFMLGLLAPHDPAALAAWHEDFMREVVRPAILPQAIELVRQHLAAGDLCVLVSATNTFVTAPIARAFGFAHLLGTVPEYEAGRYTGRLVGAPCFQAGKITHVDAWLAARGQAWDDFAETWFYSDSTNDLPLLERVSHPVATNPSPTLRARAEAAGWQIRDLFAGPADTHDRRASWGTDDSAPDATQA